METLNLQKGDLLNLSKNYSKLNNIDLGLGWDVSTGGRPWDLDVSAIALNDNGELVEAVYYGNLNGTGIKLNGDNLTGIGDGDDEIITVNLNSIPSNVKIIGFFVNIFSANGRDFSKVKNAYIRMVDKDRNEEVCKYKLNESGKGYDAFHFANLERVNNEWRFKTIGEGTNGGVFALNKYFQQKVNQQKITQPKVINNSSKETITEAPQTITNNTKKGFFTKLFSRWF